MESVRVIAINCPTTHVIQTAYTRHQVLSKKDVTPFQGLKNLCVLITQGDALG